MPIMRHVSLLLFLALHRLRLAATAADQFTFDGFAGASLTLDGTAAVTADGLLMLTNGTTLLKGHAFYPSPLRFHRDDAASGADVRSFSAAYVFGIVSEYADLSSPGLAFVVARSKDFFSTALQSQYMGLANSVNNGNSTNHFLAVELDTIVNAEFGDMSDNHVGINVNGLVSRVADDAGYYEDGTGAFRNMSLLNRTAAKVWVDFDARTSLVNVTMAPLELPKPRKPLLSTTMNLSAIIEGEAFVGFSSSTGVVSSRHYVLAWSFRMDGPAPPLNISKLPALPVTIPKPDPSKILKIVLPIASAAFVFALAIIILMIRRRWHKYAELKEDWEATFGPHRFSYKDLFHATRGFCDEHLLGIGGFGRVYRGVLPVSRVEVAVKKVSHESRQGMKEFVAEVVTIGQLRHRNLVQLLGYCRREGELLLVYDYMANGSLDKFLHHQNGLLLNWSQRFRIIKGVACSLLYLHEDWEQVVLHRDIKASNVLLDADMNGRLGDFGLARLYDHGTDPHTTHVVGTMGYLAPELGHTGRASKASDVFAFGVFMLEVTCGRRPVVQDEHGDRHLLVDWVVEQWRRGTVTEAVDPRLRGDFAVEEACPVLKLSLLCSHPLPGARPGIRQITQFLDGSAPLPELSEAHLGFNLQALMRNHVLSSLSSSSTVAGNISDIPAAR
ncbi:L-type lectin-domain containing receptor kinase IV.2 [Dichanthelium oligosanthes]|uniref:non-specific serine/threonine protein kinase n=1 Tax=Dichanthelium oligosanthes TaxID=888268 RepID=A0A1E5UX70_9POAL|nr:L-type lectin-domain containing receptor kinase IV.2 [Dichanthelium oligosanthes]